MCVHCADNYLNNLYEAPAVLSVVIYQKSFSFTSALSSQQDSKLGEVEIPLDNISDRHAGSPCCDWYPLSQSVATAPGRGVAKSSSASSSIWLLYLQLQLSYSMMAGVE